MGLATIKTSSYLNTWCINYGSFALQQFLAAAGIQSVHIYITFLGSCWNTGTPQSIWTFDLNVGLANHPPPPKKNPHTVQWCEQPCTDTPHVKWSLHCLIKHNIGVGWQLFINIPSSFMKMCLAVLNLYVPVGRWTAQQKRGQSKNASTHKQ